MTAATAITLIPLAVLIGAVIYHVLKELSE